jgi:HK97 family phage major capsid protein
LKGSGVSPQLGPGLYSQASAAAAPPVTTPPATVIDQLYLAAAELAAAGYTATGAVMAAADYVAMQLLKDTAGRYILGGGLPLPRIVVSPALASGEWLVGDFERGSHLFVREDASIQIAAQNEDDFTRNLLTILAELRVALTSTAAAFRKNPAGATTMQDRSSKR